MPWSSNADLPASVKGLPAEAQSVFRRVANQQLEAGKSDSSAMAIAWTAVKSGWKKEGREWVKKGSATKDGIQLTLFDSVLMDADGLRETRDGYMTGTARVARTGIQLYKGKEVDPDNQYGMRDRETVRVYRSPEEIYTQDAMHSFAFRPITDEHPDTKVTSANWRKLAAGSTGPEVVKDSDGKVEYIRVPLVLMDAGLIKKVKDGKRELSMGYETELLFRDGITPQGESYDAIQTDIRANHLAVVSTARGGDKLRIGDKESETMTKTIMVDGLQVEVTDAAEAAIIKLQGTIKTLTDAAVKADATAAADKATLNDALIKKDAEIAVLKTQVMTADLLDKAIVTRSKLINDALRIYPQVKVESVSDADIRKSAVTAKLGDAAVAGKEQAFFDHVFDALVVQLPAEVANNGDTFTRTLQRDTGVNSSDSEKARLEAEDAERNAWKTDAKKKKYA